jgi:exosortase
MQEQGISLPANTRRWSGVFALTASLLALWVLFFGLPYTINDQSHPASLFGQTLSYWLAYPEWAQGMLVFPIVALIFYLKRKDFAKVPQKGSWLGLPVLLFAVILYWFGYLTDLPYAGQFSIQLFIAGLIIWFLGVRYFSAVFFLWAVLIFAWPFLFLDQYVSLPLRFLMSRLSATTLNLIGIHALREGTAILSTPDSLHAVGQRFAVDVADPCSGMHSLYALTLVATLYGILMFRRWWQSALIVFLAVPFAVFGNVCRILALVLGTLWFGSSFAVGSVEQPSWYHTGAGVLVYIAALGGLFVVGSILGFITKTSDRSAYKGQKE